MNSYREKRLKREAAKLNRRQKAAQRRYWVPSATPFQWSVAKEIEPPMNYVLPISVQHEGTDAQVALHIICHPRYHVKTLPTAPTREGPQCPAAPEGTPAAKAEDQLG